MKTNFHNKNFVPSLAFTIGSKQLGNGLLFIDHWIAGTEGPRVVLRLNIHRLTDCGTKGAQAVLPQIKLLIIIQ